MDLQMNRSKDMARGKHLDDEVISAYIDGALSEKARRHVDAHLAGCPACAEKLEATRRTVSLLRELPERPVPHSFVLREADVMPARRSTRTPLFAFLRTATVAVSLLLAVVLAGDLLLSRQRISLPAAPVPMAERAAVQEKGPEALEAPATAVAEAIPPTPTEAPEVRMLVVPAPTEETPIASFMVPAPTEAPAEEVSPTPEMEIAAVEIAPEPSETMTVTLAETKVVTGAVPLSTTLAATAEMPQPAAEETLTPEGEGELVLSPKFTPPVSPAEILLETPPAGGGELPTPTASVESVFSAEISPTLTETPALSTATPTPTPAPPSPAPTETALPPTPAPTETPAPPPPTPTPAATLVAQKVAPEPTSTAPAPAASRGEPGLDAGLRFLFRVVEAGLLVIALVLGIATWASRPRRS